MEIDIFDAKEASETLQEFESVVIQRVKVGEFPKVVKSAQLVEFSLDE